MHQLIIFLAVSDHAVFCSQVGAMQQCRRGRTVAALVSAQYVPSTGAAQFTQQRTTMGGRCRAGNGRFDNGGQHSGSTETTR